MSALLLVEDAAASGGPPTRALEKAGHYVRGVTAGGDAEVGVFDVQPELVVLDLGLPDIDGLEVCRHLRSAHEHLPIIVLTARREELDIVEGFEAGADDYLTKPFRPREMRAKIAAMMRRKRPQTPVGAHSAPQPEPSPTKEDGTGPVLQPNEQARDCTTRED